MRNEPTQANAQAAVAAQDAAMKQAEAIQQNAIGIQQRAILQGKAVKKTSQERPKDIPIDVIFENSKKFGHKAGKHVRELGLDPALEEDREKYKNIMRETVKFAVKVKQGFYSKQEPETFCFEKGDMVVLLRTNGTFVTAYTKANSIKAHLALEEREWYKNMKIRFDITE